MVTYSALPFGLRSISRTLPSVRYSSMLELLVRSRCSRCSSVSFGLSSSSSSWSSLFGSFAPTVQAGGGDDGVATATVTDSLSIDAVTVGDWPDGTAEVRRGTAADVPALAGSTEPFVAEKLMMVPFGTKPWPEVSAPFEFRVSEATICDWKVCPLSPKQGVGGTMLRISHGSKSTLPVTESHLPALFGPSLQPQKLFSASISVPVTFLAPPESFEKMWLK